MNPRKTILVVDDESSIRDVTRKTLSKNGFNVLSAGTGMEALTLFTQQQSEIRLVLTDLMMPQMDGLELARALRQLSPNVPIILSSGLSDNLDDTRQTVLKLSGITKVLSKPYTAKVLLSTIREQIDIILAKESS